MSPALAFLFAAASLTPLNEGAVQKLISANKGKVLVINFWATWCGPCRKEMPDLLSLERRNAAKGVKLVLISADEASDGAKAGQFLGSVNASQPWYIKNADDDDKFINAFDSKWSGALPATFVYDRTGKRVRSFIGEVDLKQLEALLATL